MAADRNTRVLCVHWASPLPPEKTILGRLQVATLTQAVLEYRKKYIKNWRWRPYVFFIEKMGWVLAAVRYMGQAEQKSLIPRYCVIKVGMLHRAASWQRPTSWPFSLCSWWPGPSPPPSCSCVLPSPCLTKQTGWKQIFVNDKESSNGTITRWRC